MDSIQVQPRANIQPSKMLPGDGSSPKSDVSYSSDNNFSDALESALGLDEDGETAVTTTLSDASQTLLNDGKAPTVGQQEGDIKRQDMPVDSGLLPPPGLMPVIMMPSVAINSDGVSGSVTESAIAGGIQKDSGGLTSTMFFLKTKEMGAIQNGALSLISTQSTPDALPLLAANSQSITGLSMAPQMITPGLVPVTSPLQNKISTDILANFVNDNLLQIPAPAITGENGSLTTGVMSVQPTGVSNAPTLTTLPAISTPVGMSGWDQELGGRVQWMMTQGLQAAALHINPPHLGPIEVRIIMDQDQASISFSAPHMLTRDALEASIPKLRDMFTDNGLNLGNVSVATNSFSDHRGQHPGSAAIHPIFSAMDNAPDDVPQRDTQTINNLVDYYA